MAKKKAGKTISRKGSTKRSLKAHAASRSPAKKARALHRKGPSPKKAPTSRIRAAARRGAIRKGAQRGIGPAAFEKPARMPDDLVTAAMGLEEIVAQVSEGHPEEASIKKSKFDIGVVHNAQAMPAQEIPLEYGKNQVMILVVDPSFVFTYWEVRHDTLAEAQHRLGPGSKLTLRFYDITHTGNPDTSPCWDVEVFDRLGNWYLRLTRPEQRLCMDIGIRSPSGEFWRFARSNVMRLPQQSLAAPGPIKWMVVTPSGETLISDVEDYTDADLSLLKKILGPYFFDLLMRGRFASLAGSSLEAIFYDVEALRLGQPPGASPSSPLAWARQ